jgi:serine protease Do
MKKWPVFGKNPVRIVGLIMVMILLGSLLGLPALPAACGRPQSSESAEFQDDPIPRSIDDEITQSRQNAITRAVAEISPAVVGINVTQIRRYVQRPFFDDPFWDWFYPRQEYLRKVKGLGSGFLISADGYILTNEHVVQDAQEIVVTTTDGKQYAGSVAGENQLYDVALLKIEGENFPYIALGNSEDVLIGEWVIALGNPFGLFDVASKPTVTVGVVSAVGMDFQGDLEIQGRSYEGMIQTDASINGGNSGGPLVNSLGQCIGINTFIISGSSYQNTSIGLGFAIPINRVKEILPDLKRIRKTQERFKTGLEVENISRIMALMLGIAPGDGVIVSRVHDRSTAQRAGFKVGDVIVAIDGTRMKSTADVQRFVRSIDLTKQQAIVVTVFRDGRLSDKELELERE